MSTDKKGKGKGKDFKKIWKQQKSNKNAEEPSLLSNQGVLNSQDDTYEPPTVSLKKYLYSSGGSTSIPSAKQNPKLSHHLHSLNSASKASAIKSHEHDDLLLPYPSSSSASGIPRLMETEGDLERTWKVTQEEIKEASAVGVKGKGVNLELGTEYGAYNVDWSLNGRHLALVSQLGHLSLLDSFSRKLHTELHLRETCRAVKWLHDESFVAVAQKKWVYIYDKQGLEVHQMKDHLEVNRMEFVRWAWLLATVGNPGYLKYHDTSTGKMVAEHRTKLGACDTMALDSHSGVVNLGHKNGTVTLWTPSIPRSQVTLLAHLGPVTGIALDPSSQGYRMATSGLDGTVKIWDSRTWKCLKEFRVKRAVRELRYSGKGLLAVGWGNHVHVYSDPLKPTPSPNMAPTPYMTHTFPSLPVHSLQFQPWDDLLTVGHSRGISSLVIPGAGEANYDSLVADPYENKNRRREREVQGLLDKIPIELITLDRGERLGRLDLGKIDDGREDSSKMKRELGIGAKGVNGKSVAFARKSRVERLEELGVSSREDFEYGDDEDVEGEDEEVRKMKEDKRKKKLEVADAKKRMRGKSSTLKKMLRKRRRDVVDPQTVALKEKLAKQREATKKAKQNALAKKSAESGQQGALDRFGF
ncbi:BING4CT-domain-containing protein [Meredithblackwellia eburnea MCA 4105]